MVLMVVIGGILLLPGICALAFVGSDPKGMLTDPTGLALVVLCMAIAAGGVALIWFAVRSQTRRPIG
jgi:hypothetical protein